MVQRLYLSLLLVFGLAIIAGLFLISPMRAAGAPLPLACPNKQTAFLSGSGAPAGEALIAYLGTRPVGGGSARVDGSWRIPLFVNERPGVYPVDVKVRGTRALVASFTCYVDVPIEMPSAGAASPEGGADTPVATLEATTTFPSPMPGAEQPTPRSTVTSATTTATRSPTVNPAATTDGTTTTTATTTRTPVSQSNVDVVISEVVCRDPQNPEDSEYIELRNDEAVAVDLVGWQIINTSRSNISYTFPSYTMDPGPNSTVWLNSGIGTDDPEFAELYWNRTDQLWFVGDQAELYDIDGKLVDSYKVTASDCSN